MRPARLAVLAALAAVFFGIAGPALADREAAEFFAKRGDKALRERNYAAAEEAYRRSLGDDESYLPARLGLAEALVGAGRTPDAIPEFRRVVEAAEGLKPPVPAGWADLGAKAKKRLLDLDTVGASLAKIQSRYADDLLALAAKWQKSDPGLAERALRRALIVLPAHAKAVDLLQKMGLSATSATEDLWNGTDFDGWDGATSKIWSIADGAILGSALDAAYEIHTNASFKGEFDVRLEARVVEPTDNTMFGLVTCVRGEDLHWRYGVYKDRVVLDQIVGPGESGQRRLLDVHLRNLKPAPDAKAWNRFELRFRADEVTAVLNGQVIGKTRRPKDEVGGAVGMLVQDGRAGFRRIEVVQR